MVRLSFESTLAVATIIVAIFGNLTYSNKPGVTDTKPSTMRKLMRKHMRKQINSFHSISWMLLQKQQRTSELLVFIPQILMYLFT